MMQYTTHYREKQYTWMNKLMAQTLHFYNCTIKMPPSSQSAASISIGISFFKVKRLYSG